MADSGRGAFLAGIESGAGRTALVVVPHADDAAIGCGGLLIRWAAAGWRIVLLRVTDDATDSVGLDRAETVRRARAELEVAARLLGIAEIIDLGYETDTLGDASERRLRERLIRAIRSERPYALLTFDPFGGPGENNQDHLRVAAAADEAFWTAMFDKHHPEHLGAGFAPHGVYERWYFARRLLEVTVAIDISDVIEAKVAAIAAHRTMVANMIHMAALQARTGGVERDFARYLEQGDPLPFVDRLTRARAARAGARHGVAFAEEYRRVVFSDLATVLV